MSQNLRIGLLGAYERDNFGDILFLELSRSRLAQKVIAVASPFGDVGVYTPDGTTVEPLREAIHRVDAVWVVGGEVGGTRADAAFIMAASDSELELFLKKSGRGRREHLERLSGRSVFASPYLPRMSANSATLETRLIVNSVGVSGLGGLRGVLADEAWGAIEEASFVSVRDSESSETLSRRGIVHTLVPDFVHSLAATHSNWRRNGSASRPYALIHAKGTALQEVNLDLFARALVATPELRGLDWKLFTAGSARGHDSVERYEELRNQIMAFKPTQRVEILSGGSALQKAELIAQAEMWIGTSLHGLIIASAFEVPRVGMALNKLVKYARTWGEPMPVGQPLGRIGDAVGRAFRTEEVPGRALELATAALQNFDSAAEALNTPLSDEDLSARAERSIRLNHPSLVRVLQTQAIERLRRLKEHK